MQLSVDDGRFERKFVVNESRWTEIILWMQNHPLKFNRSYASRMINSLYFDSIDYEAYNLNVSGISRRSKLRLRWYGEELSPTDANMELKLRRNELGWKISNKVSNLPSFSSTLWHDIACHLGRSLDPYLGTMMATYSRPVLICRYHREYFESTCRRVRLTIDTQHSALDQRFTMQPNIQVFAVVPSPVIIELKYPKHDRKIGDNAAYNLPARGSRHSKYVVSLYNMIS